MTRRTDTGPTLLTGALRSREERDLARRLAEVPAGEPPADLLDRLKADVPDDLGAPRRDRDSEPGPPRPAVPRRWIAAAAVVVTLVGGGYLAWQVSRTAPSLAPRSDVATPGELRQVAPPAGDRTSEAIEPEADRRDGEAVSEEGREQGGGETLPDGEAGWAGDGGARRRGDASTQGQVEAGEEAASAEVGELRRQVEGTPTAEAGSPGAAAVEPPPSAAPAPAGARSVPPAPRSARPPERHEGDTPGARAGGAGGDPEHLFEEEIVVTGEAPVVVSSSITVGGARREVDAAEESLKRLEAPARAPAEAPPPAEPRHRGEEKASAGDDEGAAGEATPEVAEEALPESAFVEDLTLDLPPPVNPPPVNPPPVNPVVKSAVDRLSTFGLDVDTGSWTVVRTWLDAGRLPPPAAVRVEEVVNAQPYADLFAAAPARPGETFRLVADGAPSPFTADPALRLLRFRVAARPPVAAERRPVVLTLVVDVSGSMEEDLPLVRSGVLRLLEGLRGEDRVALVSFSDEARVEAPHGDPAALRRAVDALATRGGTNAEAGLLAGYGLARSAFDPAAVNRVLLLSDGVANLGETTAAGLLARVRREAAEGIELTTVGVGLDEYDDALMERLADDGDGRYAYVGDAAEAQRLFTEELDGTLQTVAEEARVQVELDPRWVESWRLLGYENRAIADPEFRYDSVDAGEVGPGHSVTALYEVKLRGEPPPGRPLALLKLRWREPATEGEAPGGGRYREVEQRLLPDDLAASWSGAPADLRLAATAAALAEVLRRSPHAPPVEAVIREARSLAAALPADHPGREAAAELARLAEAAAALLAPARREERR